MNKPKLKHLDRSEIERAFTPFEAIVFDAGGVLVDWTPQKIFARLYSDPDTADRVHRATVGHPDWLDLDRGTLDEKTAIQRFSERTERPATEMARLFDAVRESLVPIAPSIELLTELHALKKRLYLLSNISVPMFDFLRRRDRFWRYFTGTVISGAINMLKPEREIYEHLLETHKLRGVPHLFIDDREENVRAAELSGVRALQFSEARNLVMQLQALLR
jgi:HAD superfamily hydrolase (TIGR01509 family)